MDINDFSYDDDGPDEEQIKSIRLMIFWEKNFENVFFEGGILKSLMKNNFI